MQIKKQGYTEDDVICFKCIEDHALRVLIKSEGTQRTCVLCGQKNTGVTIEEFAKIIDPVFRTHFGHGKFVRQYDPDHDNSYYEEQQGDDLSWVLQELLRQELDCEDALVHTLEDIDPYNPQDGEEPFYDSAVCYQSIPVDVGELYGQWNAISDDLKKRRRFFSNTAKEFFDWLFEGLEDLWLYAEDLTPDLSATNERNKLERLGVVIEWPAGTTIFRGRRADNIADYTRILLNPHVELSPPPSNHTIAGRMNPNGVSLFYGALKERTCLAEMRSSIGSHIVVACFETSKTLRIFDFTRLDKAYSGGKVLSYFQEDFEKQVSRQKFRRQLHRIISQPILPGHEGEYLITQVLAEYLAYVRESNFDGVLFGSTQHEGGINIVLFPKSYSEEADMLTQFSVKQVKKSAKLYRTRKITYDTPRLDFSLIDDTVYLHHDHEDNDGWGA
jgi:uncharacterized CHY-type Zn-finger protein